MTSTTSSALSGNSPNTGVIVSRVVNWSCDSEKLERTRRAGVSAVPLPHEVGELGAWSAFGTNPSVGSPWAHWYTRTVDSLTVQGERFSLKSIVILLPWNTITGAEIAGGACG